MKRFYKFLTVMAAIVAVAIPWVSRAQNDCTPISTFPVTYGFEASEGFTTTVTAATACTTNVFNSCWRNEATSGSATSANRIWHIYGGTSATYLHSGAHSLMLPDKGSSSALHTTMLTFPAMNFTNPGGYVVSFWIQRNGTGTSTPEGFKIYASPTDTIGPGAVELGHYSRHRTMAYPCIEATNGWYQYETAPITMTGTVYIIFEGQSYYSSSTYIDDVVIMEAPTCIKVTDLAVNAALTTTNSLTLTWTDNSNTGATYNIYSFTDNDTTLVQSGITSTTYTVTGLDAGTSYTFAVVTDCGGGDTSMFSTRVTAFTACANIAAADLPYSEDFESYTSGSTNLISPCWSKGTNSTTAYPYPYSTAGIASNIGLYMYGYHPSSGNDIYSWAALPPVDDNLNLSSLMLNMDIKRGSTASNYYTTLLYVGVADSVAGFSSAANIESQVVWIDTLDFESAAASSIHAIEIDFASYTGNGKYVVLYAPTPELVGTATYRYNYVYVDNVVLRVTPTCFWPTDIEVADITTDGATIAWTPDPRTSTPAGWNIEYGEHGFTLGEGNTTSSYTTQVTLTGLNANTEYDAYVRADCGGEVSDPVMISFRTGCEPFTTLPYTENFDNVQATTSTTPAEPYIAPCWDIYNNGTRANYQYCPYVYSSSTYAHSGSGCIRFYSYTSSSSGDSNQYLILPAIDSNIYHISTLQVGFWLRAYSTSSSYHADVVVGVMTDPMDESTFEPLATYTNNTTTYEYIQHAFGNYTGPHGRIAFKFPLPTATSNYNYGYVDDVTIEEMPNCPPVVDLTAQPTTGNALLAWDYMDGYDEPSGYEVVYDSVGGNNPTTLNISENSTMLTGLAAGTAYKVYVMADCGGEQGSADSVQFSTAPFECFELDSSSLDTIIFSNSTSGQSGCLAYSSYGNTVYQTIYTAAELSAAGLTAGPITGIDLGFTGCTSYNKEFTIFIGNTSTTSISTSTIEDPNQQTQVYGPALHPMNTSGWQHYDFTTSFNWDGSSSIIITTFMNQSGGSQTTSTGLTGYYVSAANTARYHYKDSNPFTLADYNSGNAASTYSYRAAIHFYQGECSVSAICAAPVANVTYAGSDTISISWIPGYDESEWDLAYRIEGESNWTVAATGVSETSYSFGGLIPGSDYELRVSFECDDNDATIYSSTVSARTECLALTIPYSYGFEDLATGSSSGHPDIPCWRHINNGTSYMGYPYVYASAAHSGSRGLYWYASTTAGTYGDYEILVLPAVDTNVNPINTLMLSFWAKPTGLSYAPVFYVGVMSDPDDISTFEYVDTINLITGNTYWALYESKLNSYTGQGRYIALRANRPSSLWYAYTDDFTVDVIPSCPHVTDLVVDSNSISSVSLSWTAGSTESSWSVTDGTHYYVTNTPNITVSGLNTNTAYTFEVRALCAADDSSNVWSINARTACDPYLSLPYAEDFEGYTNSTTAATGVMVPCWNYYMTGSATYQVGAYLPQLYYYSTAGTYSHSGNYSMRLYGVGYHTLPQLPCPADSVTMGFWVRQSSTSYLMYVGLMSDPNDGSTFDTVMQITNSGTSVPEYHEIDFSSYTGTGRYIAFRNVYTSASTYYSYQYLDDIEVWRNTSCPSPVANIGTVDHNSIQVTWFDTTADATLSGVNIYWSTDNSYSHAQSTSVTTGNSYTISGLTPGTDYWIWIAGNCGNEESRPQMMTATTASDCSPVENLTLGGTDYNTFGISWTAPTVGNAASSYIVTLRKCTNTPFGTDNVVVTDTVTNTYYLFTNLEEATTYSYSVTTLCNSTLGETNTGFATTTICEMDTVGDYSTNYSAQPFYATQAYSYTQQIYLASELAGIDSISSIAFYQRGYDYEDRDITVYLGHTTLNEFGATSDVVPLSNLTQVYSGRLSGFGWISLKLDSTFVLTPGSNLVVAIDDNTGVAQSGNCYWACSNFSTIYRALRYYGTTNVNPASPSGSSARDYYRAYIVFGNANCEPNPCPMPIVMQSATYSDHVDITWNAAQGTSYDIYYRANGEFNWTSVATGNTTGSATIGGLGAGFLGEARVSYTCGGQTMSGTTQISTLCGAVSLPLMEDFQACDYGHYTRNCWVTGLTNAANADREYPYITSLTGDENNMLCFLYYGGYVILPEVDTLLSECQIRYKLTQGGTGARLLFGVIDDASMPIQTMHVLDTVVRSDIDPVNNTVNITYSFADIPAAYEHARICFWDAFSDNYSFIDDIVVELIPACTPASDVTATATATSATISWTTEGENATSYFIVYGPHGFAPGQGDTLMVSGTPATINALNHSTTYDAYIYSTCGLINATSPAAAYVEFTTDCAPYTTLPYVMNFENIMPAGTSAAGYEPNCWVVENPNSQAYIAYTTTSGYASSPQHAYYMNENGVVVLPEMGVPLNTLMLNFHEYNVAPQTNGLIVGTVAHVNTGFASTFVPYDTIIFMPNQNIYDVTSYMVDYTGTATRLALMNYNTGSGTASEHYIDDLTIDVAPACIPPQNVHADMLVGNEATIVWNRSNSAGYTVEYGLHGFTPGTGTQVATSQRNVTLTGLTPETEYDVYVWGNCDTVAYSFTTPCNVVSLPYIENFDSYTTSTTAASGIQADCWDFILTGPSANQTSSYYPQVYYSTTYANSGNYCYRFYGVGIHMLPPMPTTLDSLQITFNTYKTTDAYELEVGVMEGSLFVPIQNITYTSGNHTEVTVTFNNYQGNSRIIAFRNTHPTYGYSYHYIDDVEVEYIPTCPRVNDLHATNITNNSVTLAWTNGGSESQWLIDDGTTQVVANTNPYTINGLTSNTEYTFEVRPFCAVGDTGRARVITVTTFCDPVSLPYSEDFDSHTTSTTAATGVFVPCWNSIMTGTSSYQTGSYLPQIYYSSTYANSGSYSYRLYGNGYHMLPPMPTSLDSLQLTFSEYTTSASYGLEVGVMEGTTFVPVQTITSPTSTHADHTVYFASYTGNSRTIAFRNYYTTSTTTYYSYHYIDDVVVDYVPSCAPVMAMEVDSVSTNSITIDWVDVTPATEYQIEYGEPGFAHGTGTLVTTNSHPYTVNGLTPSSVYQFYVRPVCAVGDTAIWSAALIGGTECLTTPLPYSENFDAYNGSTYSTAGVLPICWDGYSNGTNAAYFPHITGSGSYWYPHSQPNVLTMTSGSASYGDTKIVALPPFEQPLSTLSMTFWYRMESATNGSTLTVGYVTGSDFAATFVPVKTIESTTTITFDSVSFDTVTATSGRLAFKWYYNTSFYSCGIDDINVTSTGAFCPSPNTNVTAVSYNEATVSIVSQAQNFEVGLKLASAASFDDAADQLISTPTYTFTGLQPATQYQYRVRAICDSTEGLISNWTIGSFTTDSLPCFDPTELAVQTTGYTTVTLGWTANGEETNWRIHVWNTAFDTTYDVNTNPATVGGLAPDVDYSAEVMALCGAVMLESGVSNTVTFHTAMCEVPTGVTVNNVTAHTAVVSWTGTAQSYRVTYGYEGFGTGNEIAAIPVTGTTTTLTGLESGETYDVYVYAVCETGIESNASTKQTFETDIEGISTADGMNVSIYPNPTTDATTIALSGVNGEVSITIVDMNGRIVKSDSMSCEGDCTKRMEVNGLAQGAYFVRINGEGLNMVKKLVVK